MAVIHLNDRLTESNEAFENYKKSSESLIYFESSQKDSFSIDFTVGERWAEYAGLGHTPHLYKVEKNLIEIKPKQSVIVETKEKIMVPHNLFGIIMPTGSLFLNNGIICNTAKIEPGYEDKLFLLLYNTSNSSKKLNVGDKITTAVFFSTEETPNSVQRKSRPYPSLNRPYGWKKRFIESVKSNYQGNPYLFIFELVKLLVTFMAGATFAFLLAKYFIK